jgi:hypothetical protein
MALQRAHECHGSALSPTHERAATLPTRDVAPLGADHLQVVFPGVFYGHRGEK